MTLSLAVLRLAFAGALGLGAHLLTKIALDLFYVYVIQGRRSKLRLREVEPARLKALTEEELYGVAGTSWGHLQLLAAGGGAILTMLLFPPAAGLMRFAGVTAFFVPWFLKSYLMGQGRRRVQGQVYAFITDLRLALALEGSLGPTLIHTQKQGPGILYERLGLYIETRLTSGAAHEVLQLLAQDMRSPDFDDLMHRLMAAERGLKSYEAALQDATERVSLEVYGRRMQALKAAPVRLIIPILLTIFAPTIVLVMYPLVASVVEGLTVSSGMF